MVAYDAVSSAHCERLQQSERHRHSRTVQNVLQPGDPLADTTTPGLLGRDCQAATTTRREKSDFKAVTMRLKQRTSAANYWFVNLSNLYVTETLALPP